MFRKYILVLISTLLFIMITANGAAQPLVNIGSNNPANNVATNTTEKYAMGVGAIGAITIEPVPSTRKVVNSMI